MPAYIPYRIKDSVKRRRGQAVNTRYGADRGSVLDVDEVSQVLAGYASWMAISMIHDWEGVGKTTRRSIAGLEDDAP
jgi:hypothetical protein